MVAERIVCWEPNDVTDPVLRFAEKLYEQTLDADERIPWEWIARTVTDRRERKPAGWIKHLMLAAPADSEDPASLAGYAFGAFLPGYGGYLSYVGVADSARKQGVGTRLFEAFTKVLSADAAMLGEPFPFMIWESYRPGEFDPPAANKLWSARLRLFDRAGGFWIEGCDLLTPNWAEEESDPVPLQLFLKPMDEPQNAFTPDRLREVIAGLQERVYHVGPGESNYDMTMASCLSPRLRPTSQAAVRVELV